MGSFSWGSVDPDLVRSLVAGAYQQEHRTKEAAEAESLGNEEAARVANRVFRGIGGRKSESAKRYVPDAYSAMAAVLANIWLSDPSVADSVVEKIAWEVDEYLPYRRLAAAERDLDTRSGQLTIISAGLGIAECERRIRLGFQRSHRTELNRRNVAGKSSVEPTVEIVGSNAAAPDPYAVQQQAWDILSAAGFGELAKPPISGLVVLPTGAGKTDLMARWLLENVLHPKSKLSDARVLWLAHRQELLVQAANRFAALGSALLPEGHSLQGCIIHSAAMGVDALGADRCRVAFASLASLARSGGRKSRQLERFLAHPTFVVMDEAHHAGAPSYSSVLDQAFGHALLGFVGMTATPTPTGAEARRSMRDRFGDTPIVEGHALELMERGILARPTIHTVNTTMSFSISELVGGDLSGADLRRIGQHPARNRLLLDIYLQNREAYGPTLIFAVDTRHADVLGDMFAQHVEAGVLHSKSNSDRGTVLDWFRHGNNDRVLISVGMLTEGVDLPQAKTVLLARPTASSVLLHQMIGRVLRGPRAGGNATANIVYLADRWPSFPEVLDPAQAMPDIEAARKATTPSSGSTKALPPLADFLGRPIPAAVDAGVTAQYLSASDVPEYRVARSPLVGYYRANGELIPVLEHQLAGFEDLIRASLENPGNRRSRIGFFGEVPDPLPAQRALSVILEHVKVEREGPEFVEIDDRLSARSVAEEIRESGPLLDDDRGALIRERWESTILRSRYPDYPRFEEEVERTVGDLRNARFVHYRHTDARSRHRTRKRLKPQRNRTLDHAFGHAIAQIDRLRRDGRLRQREVERIGSIPKPVWSDRVVGSYWGFWTRRRGRREAYRSTIRVNLLLRTSKLVIPDTTLGFVIFHEMLHHLMPLEAHSKRFREAEDSWSTIDADAARLETLDIEYLTSPNEYRATWQR